MLPTSLLLTALTLQTATPVIEPSSIYGMKTYGNGAEFGFLPDRFVIGLAPSDLETISMHVLTAAGAEKAAGGFYGTETPYPAFQVLRFKAMPTVTLAEPGAYVMEFRHEGKPISRFPFQIQKKASGDEFNPIVSWEFITPVDKAATLNFSNVDNGQVWIGAWLAQRREGMTPRASVSAKLSHGGKVIAEALPITLHEPENMRRGFKLFKPGGRTPFKKSDLLALSGAVTGTVNLGAKAIRTYTWTVTGGKVKVHPRSEGTHAPRTDYWIPRRLAGSPEGYQFFHLEEQYWAMSK